MVGRGGGWGSKLPFPVFSRTCETFYGTERNNLAAWETLIAALKLPRFSHPAFRTRNNISTTLPCASRIACGPPACRCSWLSECLRAAAILAAPSRPRRMLGEELNTCDEM